MADDLELEVNGGGDEQEGQLDISPEAQSSWDRVLEKRGLTPKEPAGGEAGGTTTAAAPPPPPGRKQAPPAPDNRTLPPARGHRQRQADRQSRAQLQGRLDKLEEMLTSLLPKDPAIDPEAEPEKYTESLIERAVLKALGGEDIVGFLRESHEAARQRREIEAQVQAETEFFDAWGEEMTTWEAEYQRDHPDLFEGYRDRLHAFIEASDRSQIALGVHPVRARRETMRGLAGLTQRALDNDIHPVAYVDHLWRQTPGYEGRNGNAGGGEAARRAQAAANRETRERRAAGAAGSTLSTTKAPPAPTAAGKMAAVVEDAPQGRGRAAAIARAARQAGGSAKQNLRQIARST